MVQAESELNSILKHHFHKNNFLPQKRYQLLFSQIGMDLNNEKKE
jgi:hypothetical protein